MVICIYVGLYVFILGVEQAFDTFLYILYITNDIRQIRTVFITQSRIIMVADDEKLDNIRRINLAWHICSILILQTQ